MTGQLVRIQGLVKGHAGSLSVREERESESDSERGERERKREEGGEREREREQEREERDSHAGSLSVRPHLPLLLFFFTLVTGPRGSLSLKLSDTRVYEPHTRTLLRNHNTFLWTGSSEGHAGSLSVRSHLPSPEGSHCGPTFVHRLCATTAQLENS
jgi:hypothetical protein